LDKRILLHPCQHRIHTALWESHSDEAPEFGHAQGNRLAGLFIRVTSQPKPIVNHSRRVDQSVVAGRTGRFDGSSLRDLTGFIPEVCRNSVSLDSGSQKECQRLIQQKFNRQIREAVLPPSAFGLSRV
jgi:hypothetical protein